LNADARKPNKEERGVRKRPLPRKQGKLPTAASRKRPPSILLRGEKLTKHKWRKINLYLEFIVVMGEMNWSLGGSGKKRKILHQKENR